jgi:hypothetical protein
MYDTVKTVLGGVVVVVFGLSALSRRFPQVEWLQHFRYDPPKLSEAQRARMQRRANVAAGVQLILLGVVLPMGYIVLTVMMFNDITRKAMAVVLTGSVVCIALGITAIVRSFRG